MRNVHTTYVIDQCCDGKTSVANVVLEGDLCVLESSRQTIVVVMFMIGLLSEKLL